MNPSEIREMTWEELHGKLDGPRQRIWQWLVVHGPATTTAMAEGTSIGLLTVRPRVTELVQMGFAECVDRDGREGVYKAREYLAAKADYYAAQGQLNLKL